MKINAGAFEGHEPQLIFIARRLEDAVQLEAILTREGVDYAVEADEYPDGIFFKTMRTGAFFYVLPEVRERAIDVMLVNGYVPAE